MRAIVKRPYFDDLGLHKVGEVVEVECASDLVELAEETGMVQGDILHFRGSGHVRLGGSDAGDNA